METISKEFYWDVGNRIRMFRSQKNYTAEKLSEEVGISAKYMYQIESGRVGFSTKILYEIANALGVSADAILSEDSATLEDNILLEVTGKFSEEEKECIKKAIMRDITE